MHLVVLSHQQMRKSKQHLGLADILLVSGGNLCTPLLFSSGRASYHRSVTKLAPLNLFKT